MAQSTSGAIKGQRRQEALAGWVFVAPAVVIMAVFLFIPILFALWVSFQDWGGLTPPTEATFAGLTNYQELLLNDSVRRTDFFIALRNTTFYSLGVVPLQTILALFLATIVNQRWLRGRGFFRTAFYFPSITSSVAISLIFLWIYQKGGLFNQLVQAIWPGYTPINWMDDPTSLITNLLAVVGLTVRTAPSWMTEPVILGLTPWQWISAPSVSLWAIMMLNIWTTAGTMMLIFLAALQDIPHHVYEAAVVDGANAWQTFRHVTVPLLRPTIFFVVTIGLIGCYQVFDQIYVMTSAGGPAKTTMTIAYLIYLSGFNEAKMGLAAATSVALFIIIFVMTMLQRRIIGERLQD